MTMVRNNSLVIRGAGLEHTGHYLCSGVNTAGAAIERSETMIEKCPGHIVQHSLFMSKIDFHPNLL